MTQRSRIIFASVALIAVAAIVSTSILIHRRAARREPAEPTQPPDFARLTNEGRAAIEHLDYPKAIERFEEAAKFSPQRLDAQLNLANAYLQADRAQDAAGCAEAAIKLDSASAGGYYILGSADLRLAHFDAAVTALQQAVRLNPAVAASHFQLGRAYQGLSQWEAAAKEIREVLAQEPEHPAAHYILGQILIQMGDRDAAEVELAKHAAIIAKQPDGQATPATFERSIFTRIQVPSRLTEQPDEPGIAVRFFEVTNGFLGADRDRLGGPVAAIDLKGDGHYCIAALEKNGNALHLLKFDAGRYLPMGEGVPVPAAAGQIRTILVGDLQNDGIPDLILLGDRGAAVYSLSSDGKATDLTGASGLAGVTAEGAVLADLDFTGKLGLWTIAPDGNSVHAFRNSGKAVFKDLGPLDVPPASITGASRLFVEDWNRDDLPDLIVARRDAPPTLLQNRRNGPLAIAGPGTRWPTGPVFALGDLNNDLRCDIVVAAQDGLHVVLNGDAGPEQVLKAEVNDIGSVYLIDLDNDGWLDIVSAGKSLHAWRNLGKGGFKDETEALGLNAIEASESIKNVIAADLDADGDTDLLLDLGTAGMRILRNDGGDANRQTKFRLIGKRSSANGLGSQIELTSGGWQTIRSVSAPTIEIGHGKHAVFDTATVHWFDLVVTSTDVTPATGPNAAPVVVKELELPTGSCPYLYAWDGSRFRFVTDILGASPLGLRVTDDHFIDADTEELVHVGDDSNFVPRDGKYALQITEELREVLYLDHASLVVADHPVGTEVHSTSKLLPGKPFPPPSLITLGRRIPLRSATTNAGTDVTAALLNIDEVRVSPAAYRLPQLRGLAEPNSITLEFESLPADKPLTLALTGWLRFGGGMANVAASHDPDLPFPFPRLEANTPQGWKPLDVIVGAPAGKTKTILVDLTNKIPAHTTSLRISTAFEIHWDRIALFERSSDVRTTSWAIRPDTAILYRHGFGLFEPGDRSRPLTPIFDFPAQSPRWLITPSGWCTRYGDVNELLSEIDNTLVLVNGGDALQLSFDARKIPEKPPGVIRDFFLRTSGWDKDADYHVQRGDTVGPLPWHGMNDQQYGREIRPPFANDAWMKKFNTRWVPAQATP